jgi:hypothetical protein
MVSIKKKRSRIKQKINQAHYTYNISTGGDVTQKICKGRSKEDCNDGTGNCKYIDGKKRKYCKRTITCKKSCGPPCQKLEYNNKMYCIPPDKNGNQQTFEDVKEIISELVIEDNNEKDEIIVEKKLDDVNLTHSNDGNLTENQQNVTNSNDVNLTEKQQNDNHSSDVNGNNGNNREKILEKATNRKPIIIKDTIENNDKNSDENNEEKGSVASILYSKSAYDTNTGSCSIL